MYDRGHGDVTGGHDPGFPDRIIGMAIAHNQSGFMKIDIPLRVGTDAELASNWSILDQLETGPPGHPHPPMAGLARLVARFGPTAVSKVPGLSIGMLFSVDQREVENLRTEQCSTRQHESTNESKTPLSIAVFGPPGAGKSFGVKEIARKLLPDREPLEFNLSQLDDPQDRVGAFHQVRDAVLRGHTLVVFRDEFDSKEYKWLRYLAAGSLDSAPACPGSNLSAGHPAHGDTIEPVLRREFVGAGLLLPTYRWQAPAPDIGVPGTRSKPLAVGREIDTQHQVVARIQRREFAARLPVEQAQCIAVRSGEHAAIGRQRQVAEVMRIARNKTDLVQHRRVVVDFAHRITEHHAVARDQGQLPVIARLAYMQRHRRAQRQVVAFAEAAARPDMACPLRKRHEGRLRR